MTRSYTVRHNGIRHIVNPETRFPGGIYYATKAEAQVECDRAEAAETAEANRPDSCHYCGQPATGYHSFFDVPVCNECG